ncbi:MAG: SH3 domain-containing protein, partial [Lachnospiraceae bacterium]|nr:SH3 domain-containing protein [Lachnospiraceae bacterium]
TEQVTTTDTVNVRSSDSENADKLGKLEQGTTVTRYEAKENGWSRIDYNGTEAYVKSEYVKVTESATDDTDSQTTETTENDNQDVETVSGKIVVLETVNVRKSASENADRIGTAYKGEYYDLIMEQADGWTKIKYNGQTGFVKSEYVKK